MVANQIPLSKNLPNKPYASCLKQEVKAIIIACNTISAVAKDTVLQLAGNIPVIDVISAGTKASCAISDKIGVIATRATINSNAYPAQFIKLTQKPKFTPKPVRFCSIS